MIRTGCTQPALREGVLRVSGLPPGRAGVGVHRPRVIRRTVRDRDLGRVQAWFPVERRAPRLRRRAAVCCGRSSRHSRSAAACRAVRHSSSRPGFPPPVEETVSRVTSVSALLALTASGPIGVVLAVFALGVQSVIERRRAALALASARGAASWSLRGAMLLEGRAHRTAGRGARDLARRDPAAGPHRHGRTRAAGGARARTADPARRDHVAEQTAGHTIGCHGPFDHSSDDGSSRRSWSDSRRCRCSCSRGAGWWRRAKRSASTRCSPRRRCCSRSRCACSCCGSTRCHCSGCCAGCGAGGAPPACSAPPARCAQPALGFSAALALVVGISVAVFSVVMSTTDLECAAGRRRRSRWVPISAWSRSASARRSSRPSKPCRECSR